MKQELKSAINNLEATMHSPVSVLCTDETIINSHLNQLTDRVATLYKLTKGTKISKLSAYMLDNLFKRAEYMIESNKNQLADTACVS